MEPSWYENDDGQVRVGYLVLAAYVVALLCLIATLGGDGSCAVTNNGPRVVCAMRDGTLSRLELREDEHLVRGPRVSPPVRRK